jgi:hypothetical protein
MHADDTSLHLHSPQDVAVVLSPGGSVGLHCRASGGALQRAKCQGLCVGPHPALDPVTRVCGVCGVRFPPEQEPLKHLGIYLGTDAAAASAASWAKLLHRIQQTALLWREHPLSWLGRAYLAKQVLGSQLCYHATFMHCPVPTWRRIRHCISAFVAGASAVDGEGGARLSHPALHIAALPWEEGGINLVDPSIQAECLMAKVAARLLHPAPHPWKPLMRARLQRAFPALGTAVLISSLQVTAAHLPDARLLGYVRGFQRTQPHRVLAPSSLPALQVRLERLCYNHQIRLAGSPLAPRAHPALGEAEVWTVGGLADRVQAGALPPALQRVWECVPAAWQLHALAPPQQPQVWACAEEAGLVRFHGQELFSVAPDMSLSALPAEAAAPPGLAWAPCCVVVFPPDPAEPEAPPRRLSLGPWSSLQVNPSVWGYGEKHLLQFTVKEASQRRLRLRALAQGEGWYVPGSGRRPRLWDPPAQRQLREDEAGPAARSGLQQLEQGWQAAYAEAVAGGRAQRRPAEAYEVQVLPCQRPGKRPRLDVFSRVAARVASQAEAQDLVDVAPAAQPGDELDALAPPPPASPDEEDVLHNVRSLWLSMHEADLPRVEYATLYRILHGRLYVGAFLCSLGVVPPQQACCTHAGCQGQLETLSHAFVLCPAVAPAAEWVCRLFAAVAGEPPPPATPAVLLAGDHTTAAGGWEPPEDLGLARLWLCLRAAYLHAVWQLRCRRSLADAPFAAAGVCAAVVASVRSSIQRDWVRTTQNLVRLAGACPEWFRGRSPTLSLPVFLSRWAPRGALCHVEGAGEEGVPPRLHVHLCLTHPAAAPPQVPLALQGAAPEPGAA